MRILANQPHPWIYVAIMAGAAVLVFRLYRRVPPSLGRGTRFLLVVLRVAALAVLLALLLEPVVVLSRTRFERPVVAVLIDASRSMAIPDGTGGATRGDEAVSLLNEYVLPRVGRDADVVAYAFSSTTDAVETDRGSIKGSPEFDGPATDIGAALAFVARDLRERNLALVVLATDGANNRGASPYGAAMDLDVPIVILGLGSTEPPPDIAIREVLTNRICYAGGSVPIRVTIASAGYADAQAVVELWEGDTLLESSPMGLSGTGEETEITFSVVPRDPGVHQYRVSVPPVPGELTTANNSRVVVTNAFKQKVRALLVGRRPSWDYAFLKRELASDGNVELSAVCAKNGAETSPRERLPGTRKALFEYDLVAFVRPDWHVPAITDGWLSAFVRDRGGGLLLVGLPSPGTTVAPRLADIAPITLGEPAVTSVREARVRLTDDGAAAPVMRVVSDRFENAELWAALPPVWTATTPWWAARPDASVLLEAPGRTEDETTPIIAVRSVGAGRVMAIAAQGLWRWKMAGPDEVDLFDRLAANIVRSLTARGELARVTVSTDRDVYASGETVRLSAQVYREDWKLAHDASVTVSVSKGEGAVPTATRALSRDGDFYRGVVGPLVPGRYEFEARASIGEEVIGTSHGEFTVEQFSLEDSDVRGRPALLRKLAEDTGGLYLSPETIDRLPDSLPLEWKRTVAVAEFELWNSPWLLVMFVGLVSAEWALRRLRGLP